MLRSIVLCGGGMLLGAACSSHQRSWQHTAHSTRCAAPPTLSPNDFQPFRLIASKYESHDTRRFFFELPGETTLGIPCSSCIVAKFTDADGQDVIRPYTPISSSAEKGKFEILVKRYPKSKMGNHVHQMRNGESLLFKGPFVKFPYTSNQYNHIGMIAGGTGVTPMYQVVQEVISNAKDKTKLTLLLSNKSRKDMLLANELVEMHKGFPNFHLYVTLSGEVPKRWLGGVGRVNKTMIKELMPAPGEKKTMVLVCGPPGFMKAVSGDKDYSTSPPSQGQLDGILKELGYKQDQVFKF